MQESDQSYPSLQATIVPVTPFAQNCSILWCTKTSKAVVIDPGGDLNRIEQALTEHKLVLDKILITHGHVDHAGGTSELAKRHSVPIHGPHKEDKYWIDKLPEQAEKVGFTGEIFEPEQWLNDGDQVSFGEITLDVVHCPGHTPGHVVFIEKKSKLAVVGDVIFQGSIGRTDFPKGNHQDLISSIRDKLFPLGDDIQFIPGHGNMSTFGEEKRSNPFVADNRFG